MKKNLILLIIAISTVNCNSTSNPDLDGIEHLICEDYWAAINLSAFCDMNLGNFDLTGFNDSCHGDSNDSYTHDELIYIRVYNGFEESEAREDYNVDKEFHQSVDGYMERSDIGDEAFAILDIEFGKLDGLYLSVRKGKYTIILEVNGNSANDSNNCFTPDTVFDFAKALVAPL